MRDFDSKINYLDPRITVAWCKKHDVPLEKIFSNTLVNKCAYFLPSTCSSNKYTDLVANTVPWARDVDADWKF